LAPIRKWTECQAINSRYFDNPPTALDGYTVSLSTAANIESLLEHASGALFAEAEPLQQAIDANDESAILSVLTYTQNSVCPWDGVPPPT
jgi:hypothetical protein